MTKSFNDPMSQSPKLRVKILFVCVGNACRSPMAEGWANFHGKGKVVAYSAGSFPYGSIIEDAYTVMKEKGISLEGQRSKGLRDLAVVEMDVVVRMGHEVQCPVPAGFKGRVVDWDIPDPFGHGVDTFRDIRDLIEEEVLSLLADVLSSTDSA
jgi:arsenate reductase (thioredoxin)